MTDPASIDTIPERARARPPTQNQAHDSTAETTDSPTDDPSRRPAHTQPRRLAALNEADGNQFRGPLKKIAEQAIEAGKLTDGDGDGDIDFEDLVDMVEQWLDEEIEFGPIVEWATDIGFHVVAHIAVAIYQGTEKRIGRRVARDKKLLATLKARLKAG